MTTVETAGGLAGTWLRPAPAVGVLRLRPDGDGYAAVVDRPAAELFRESIEVAATGGGERVELTAGPALVGADGTRAPLRRVVRPAPAAFAQWCGWYEGGGRTVLLAQIAEEYF